MRTHQATRRQRFAPRAHDAAERPSGPFLMCGETAAAPNDHFLHADTFGHLCGMAARHGGPHRCRCGARW